VAKKIGYSELPNRARELVQLLAAQRGDSRDWTPIEFEFWEGDNDCTVDITSHDMGFSFSKDGEFLGIYNYKD
jgi:hypothetical protein